ncbi:hypothetical protein [Aquisalinus flavus]|uniref:Secreted protein n=1 Tax=Aquisalinus flavus TaxID=1526572 RepID=A0A8J2V5B0_9PROT|nr:hypothetical protein [Aquisalinus flavus]MBD0427343.1 hypothetical protein [Aquisalinus flavus]UNE47149.1 hypothetical protein FF099_03290 [Aquisalinus flavus]GGD00295.1 hypothetical protein GCM10011342_06580 [Aquisalinus flavus]
MMQVYRLIETARRAGFIALAGIAALAAAPAAAQAGTATPQGWMVTSSPKTYSNGTPYCTLQNSNTRPIIEFTIAGYRDHLSPFVGIAADPFTDVPQTWHATFRFPSGAESVKTYKKLQSGLAFTVFTSESFEEFIQDLETSGTLTVSIKTVSVDFAVHDVGRLLPVLKQCAGTLPAKP